MNRYFKFSFTNNILSLALMVAVLFSCQKKDYSAPGSTRLPVFNSFSPISARVGDTIIIVGKNFSDVLVAFSDTMATIISFNDSVIKCKVPVGVKNGKITVTTTTGIVTSPSDFKIYTAPSSNDIASSNLIAHWTFDSTEMEDISGTLPEDSMGNTVIVTGRIGKAIQCNSAYLIYPAIKNINTAAALKNGFTLSMWVQIPDNVTLFSPLWQINGNIGDIFGLVGLAYRKRGSAFDFDGCLTHVNATGTHTTSLNDILEGGTFTFAQTEWAFITMTYNDTTRNISYYGNATMKGQKPVAATVIPANEKFELVTTNSNPGVSISKVSFGSLNTKPPFAVGPALAGWQGGNFTGIYDDVRLFNKALSDAEILALYNFGLQGK